MKYNKTIENTLLGISLKNLLIFKQFHYFVRYSSPLSKWNTLCAKIEWKIDCQSIIFCAYWICFMLQIKLQIIVPKFTLTNNN